MNHRYTILLLVVVMWIVTILNIIGFFTLGRSLKPNKDFYDLYNGNADGINHFREWDLLPTRDQNVQYKEKLELMLGNDTIPGDYGHPVVLQENLRTQINYEVTNGWKRHAFNEFVSEMIPLNRSLPDSRNTWCKNYHYTAKLPTASVIICYHNEAWSTLLRTVHSVLNRSPPKLLVEIILVDDYSTMEHLQYRLDKYLSSLSKVKLIRNNRREGLIRSRMRGAKYATGSVAIFLDSHCECSNGWLEPLLDRIANDNKIIASPVIDHISDSTFEYIPQKFEEIKIGGFAWDLTFSWISISEKVNATRENVATPIKTPTISGGLFAVDLKYFQELGMYDEQFDSWGAENFELSFKVWMCGGSLEIVPCSHVGHVFRKRFPYERDPDSALKNAIRVAKVWMDDYAKYFYQRIGTVKENYGGDVTRRKELRQKLQCKPFKWYLENVYPEMVVPGDLVASGSIMSLDYRGLCLDSVPKKSYGPGRVDLLQCHYKGGNQFWAYTQDGKIIRDEMCFAYAHKIFFVYSSCTKQKNGTVWLYDEKSNKIMHVETKKCLSVTKNGKFFEVGMLPCAQFHKQLWIMENLNFSHLSPQLLSLKTRLFD